MKAHDDQDRRRGPWRRLRLIGPAGLFLDRAGIDLGLFGVYVHRITAPDPGLDLHDHPWPFVSIVLRGGYFEERMETRNASRWSALAEGIDAAHPRTIKACRGVIVERRRWSVRRFRLTEAHRITIVSPGTVTLVLRGRKQREWGFYLPEGYVAQDRYDYQSRRPAREVQSA